MMHRIIALFYLVPASVANTLPNPCATVIRLVNFATCAQLFVIALLSLAVANWLKSRAHVSVATDDLGADVFRYGI